MCAACLNGGFLYISGCLSAHLLHCRVPSSWPQWHVVSPPPYFCIGMHSKPPLSSNFVRQTLEDCTRRRMRTTENADFFETYQKTMEQNLLYCVGTLKNCHDSQITVFTELWYWTVPHKQPMQYTLTVCSFKQPHDSWHLNHYCIKVIFLWLYFWVVIFIVSGSRWITDHSVSKRTPPF